MAITVQSAMPLLIVQASLIYSAALLMTRFASLGPSTKVTK